MAKRDYYEVLGIAKGASKDDIRKAYRRIAVANHPDKNPGDKTAEDRFKEATEAYEVLADEKKRQTYDQFGFAGLDGMQGGGGFHDFSHAFHDFEDIFGDFSGIFESFFGGGRRRSGGRSSVQRGADLRYDLEVSFEEAAFGTQKEVAFRKSSSCEHCHGSGAEPGSEKKTCPSCGGVGQVRRSSGFFSIASTCPTCGGVGYVLENPCKSCRGTGTQEKERRLKVTIPPGMETGKRIALKGEGDAGPNGGPSGDLFVVVRVAEHEYFERHGTDVYCVIPISITQASLGGEIMVSTLKGKQAKVKIPPGTQNGRIFRLKGEGIPFLNNPDRRGDMYVKILVTVPGNLSGRAKTLLRELAEVEGEDTSPKPVPLTELR